MPLLLDSSVRRPGRVALALAALLLAAGCIISPKPEPPAAGASLDPGRVTTVDSRQGTGTDVGSLLCVSGEPGSASPPGATVRIYNLDSTAPPVETVVRQDGSFSAQLPGEPGDELRIQVIGETRSDPADLGQEGIETVAQPAGGGAAPIGSTLGGAPGYAGGTPPAHCVTLDPPAELVVAPAAELRITNGCGYPIDVGSPYLRVPTPAVAIGADVAWPAAVQPGSSLSVTVQIAAGSGSVEEILFVPLYAPDLDRRAITVHTPD